MVLAGLLVFVIAFALVVAQLQLVQGQQRLDDLDARIATARQDQQELRLEVARQSSPEVVVAEATGMGMVPPTSITYLTPGVEP
jgi:cell division protein FtsL